MGENHLSSTLFMQIVSLRPAKFPPNHSSGGSYKACRSLVEPLDDEGCCLPPIGSLGLSFWDVVLPNKAQPERAEGRLKPVRNLLEGVTVGWLMFDPSRIGSAI
jgi:hypothetical protein